MVEEFVGFAVMPHVVFTEHGEPYDSDRRQHRARRSQCKNWYNNDWFDRIVATLAFLSAKEDAILVALSGDTTIRVSTELASYVSPVSYKRTVDTERPTDIEDDYESSEDDEDTD
jgi:hypothetical protein